MSANPAIARRSQPGKLRVGLFADARRQPRWLAEGLAKAVAAQFAQVSVIAIGAASPAPRPALARAYARLDQWAFGDAQPCEPVDLPALVPHARLLEDGGWSAAALAPLGLDVAFALGDFDDSLLDGIARYGVWRYSFDGLSEVAAGAPLTASALTVRLAAGGAPRVACASWSRTYPLSVARNRAQLLHKTGEFAARALREAQRSGRSWLEQCRTANRGQSPISRNQSGIFENRALTPILGTIAGRILRRGLEKALGVEHWFLAFRLGEGELDPGLAGFTRLLPPKGRDWADPFVLHRSGRYYVFFEDLAHAEGKGHIAMIEIDAQGRCSAPVRVLERDYHLSYPFLLEHEGSLYMIPETEQNRSVELYRCTEFPRRWQRERVLLEGVRLVDATLHRSPERWWLFANAAAGASRVFDDELHLYHAPGLFGDWQPHPRNPVKSDARNARPAGRLFWRNGALHRPAQICAPRYGAGLSINRIQRLSAHDYAERQVERILPSAAEGLLGLHTVNRAGHLTVVDAFMRRRRF